MPHKIYMCCDRNSCNCGQYEKTFGHSSKIEKTYDAQETKLKDLTDDQLEYELKLRKNKKTLEEIAALEKRLKDLKDNLR